MAWLAVDQDGSEYIYHNKPVRMWATGMWVSCNDTGSTFVRLPQGSIRRLLGYNIYWENDAVEIL